MKEQINHIHGGNIYKASREYGIEKNCILDYSANINPLGIPESVRQAIVSNIDNLVNYPDPECGELRAGISKYLGIPADKIVVGNGASEIIFLMVEILKPQRVLIPAPSFAEYSKAAEHFGAEVVYLRLREENGFKLDIEELIRQLNREIDLVILCNPNNPTSTLVEREELRQLLERAKEMNIIVAVDETFIELTNGGNGNSVVPYLEEFDNLFIFRAFTKLFAIPGLRLGYGVGNVELVSLIWQKKLQWSVNSLACELGKIFIEEKEYLRKTAEWIEEETAWLYEELCKFSNFKVFEPKTNFVLMKILDEKLDAGILSGKMAAKGILIRNASNFVFLDDRFVRVAVKDRKSNERFLNILKEVLENG